MKERTVLKSRKRVGRHEDVIIKKLEPFFQRHGFQTFPHSRHNIVWSKIISDIDLLLIKDDKIGIVEVKSSYDNMKRAYLQITRIKDYADFVYIATDYTPRKLPPVDYAGWLLVKDDIKIMRGPQALEDKPSYVTIGMLPRKCLDRYAKQKSIPSNIGSDALLTRIASAPNKNLKNELKSMVTCGQECDTNCPIWGFEKSENS